MLLEVVERVLGHVRPQNTPKIEYTSWGQMINFDTWICSLGDKFRYLNIFVGGLLEVFLEVVEGVLRHVRNPHVGVLPRLACQRESSLLTTYWSESTLSS